MILADAINLPLVAGLGLITIGPLTLLVTAIESLVFRLHLGTSFHAVVKRVLVANIISTVAGGLLLMFQDMIVIIEPATGRPFAYYGEGDYSHRFPPVRWRE